MEICLVPCGLEVPEKQMVTASRATAEAESPNNVHSRRFSLAIHAGNPACGIAGPYVPAAGDHVRGVMREPLLLAAGTVRLH